MLCIKQDRDVVLFNGSNGMFTRRSLLFTDTVVCGGYCVTCDYHSKNPGCRITNILLLACPKYWNNLLAMEDY